MSNRADVYPHDPNQSPFGAANAGMLVIAANAISANIDHPNDPQVIVMAVSNGVRLSLSNTPILIVSTVAPEKVASTLTTKST